jgi:hypothetical protein
MAAFNLAISYRLNGDYAATLHLDQDTLDRRRVVLTADHPYTLGTAGNLALELRAEGAFCESVELLRTTLDKYREVLGEEWSTRSARLPAWRHCSARRVTRPRR